MSKAKKMIELQLFKTLAIENLPTIPNDLSVRVSRIGDFLANGRTVQRNNVLVIEKNYADDSAVDDIINEYLSNCIDENLLDKLRCQLKPKQTFLRVHFPVKSSEWCQDDVIECETLAKLSGLKLDLDFWFT